MADVATSGANFYDLLDVPRESTSQEIRAAYLKKVKEVHPDRSKDDESEVFVQVKKAYQTLSDPKLRAEYDRRGHLKIHTLSPGILMSGPLGKLFSKADNAECNISGNHLSSHNHNGSTNNFAGKFFSHSFGEYHHSHVNEPPPLKEPPTKRMKIDFETTSLPSLSSISSASDSIKTFLSSFDNIKSKEQGNIQKIIELPFVESVSGCNKQICYNRKEICKNCNNNDKQVPHTSEFLKTVVSQEECPNCAGSGFITTSSSVQLSIPAGVVNGWIKIFHSDGDEVAPGKSGDLLAIVKVQPHPFLRRKNNVDIECDLPISIVQATLGCTLQIPSIRGVVRVEIKPGTQPNEVIVLPGEGFPNFRNPASVGDMLVRVQLTVPKKLTPRQQQLLEEFEKESVQ